MLLGSGGPHNPVTLARIKRGAYRDVAGEGTIEEPKVLWLSEPLTDASLLPLEHIIMQETSRCGQSFAFVMMGVHAKSTVSKTATTREMADDDPHVTIRMGPDLDTCKLHGHLYIHMDGPATRLMTEDERNFFGGQPRHLWIWGPYSRECAAWPRSHITLPEAPFEKKPGREKEA
ncbi:hypothetical protein F4678DRAFT_407714, partial [Xylaria arbuscula]